MGCLCLSDKNDLLHLQLISDWTHLTQVHTWPLPRITQRCRKWMLSEAPVNFFLFSSAAACRELLCGHSALSKMGNHSVLCDRKLLISPPLKETKSIFAILLYLPPLFGKEWQRLWYWGLKVVVCLMCTVHSKSNWKVLFLKLKANPWALDSTSKVIFCRLTH